MTIDSYEIIGLAAALCTTASFAPQAYKIYTEKSAKEVSLTMYLVMLAGLILWLIYGIVMNSISIKLANTVSICLVVMIIYYKLRDS